MGFAPPGPDHISITQRKRRQTVLPAFSLCVFSVRFSLCVFLCVSFLCAFFSAHFFLRFFFRFLFSPFRRRRTRIRSKETLIKFHGNLCYNQRQLCDSGVESGEAAFPEKVLSSPSGAPDAVSKTSRFASRLFFMERRRNMV